MRILLLSFEYPPETGFGGIGTYTWYHARALVRLGHDVHVLAGSREESALRTTEHDGVFVHRYRAHGRAMRAFEALGKVSCWWTRNRLENALSMYRGVRRLLETNTFDIIEMPECGAEGALLNGRIGIPTVVRAHSPAELIMPFYPVRRADVVMCSRIERRGIDRASALSACSRFLANELRDRMAVRAPIRVITNGIDLALFDGASVTDTAPLAGIPADTPTILFAGRMEERKGIHLCREIVTTILAQYDATFVFAGEDLFGYVEKELLPAVAGLGRSGSVHYLGKLDLADVRSCMQRADIVLLPSVWENCPYACIEAMAARRAIVCSDQGGMPELIQDGVNGLLAATGDAPAFARQIGRLLDDVALRKRLGDAARSTVKREHAAEHVARLAIDFYDECIRRA